MKSFLWICDHWTCMELKPRQETPVRCMWEGSRLQVSEVKRWRLSYRCHFSVLLLSFQKWQTLSTRKVSLWRVTLDNLTDNRVSNNKIPPSVTWMWSSYSHMTCKLLKGCVLDSPQVSTFLLGTKGRSCWCNTSINAPPRTGGHRASGWSLLPHVVDEGAHRLETISCLSGPLNRWTYTHTHTHTHPLESE